MSEDEDSFEAELRHAAEEALNNLQEVVKNLEQDVRTDIAEVASTFPTIAEWARALQLKNGRYCGPGQDLSQPMSPIDPCCEKHDNTYDTLGLDFSTMWSVKALLATRDADAALVACVQAVGDAGMDDVTKDYKVGLVAGFQGRVQIADWLKSHGYGT